MFKEGSGFFGATSTNLNVSVTAVPALADDSAFVSQEYPTTMVAGRSYPVTVVMRNTGESTWNAANYRLRTVNPLDNTNWGESTKPHVGTTVPGSNHTFQFNVTAPSTPGLYHWGWRMSGNGAYFGASTLNYPVTVTGGDATRLVFSNVTAQLMRRSGFFFEIKILFAVEDEFGGPQTPTHYMVSQFADMRDASWIPYQGLIVYELGDPPSGLTRYGPRRVYLRVRKALPPRFQPGTTSRPEAPRFIESQVRGATLEIEPARKTEYRFEGEQLKDMLRYAEDQGFPLQVRLESGFSGWDCENLDRLVRSQLRVLIGYMEAGGGFTKIVEVSYLDLPPKPFTPGWRVKNISVGSTSDLPANRISFSTAPAGDGFKRRIHVIFPSNVAVIKDRLTGASQRATECREATFPLQSITLEGPADDITLDFNNPWKNMFP
jgi:hypothetical protein